MTTQEIAEHILSQVSGGSSGLIYGVGKVETFPKCRPPYHDSKTDNPTNRNYVKIIWR